MKYLDYSRFASFVEEHFGSETDRLARMVGSNRDFDSGYFDIVRFFGNDGIDPREVEICYLSGHFSFYDYRIETFARHMAARLKSEGRLYDGPDTVVVTSATLDRQPHSITLQACSYPEFAGSCLALDAHDEILDDYGWTLREYYKRSYPGSELDDHPLPQGLGICGVVVDEQERALLVRRSSHLASLESTGGPSAAGSVDFESGYANLAELIDAAMMSEVNEELAFRPDEVEIVPLAWGREIFRGEKPQLFCLLKTSVPVEHINSRLRDNARESEQEGSAWIDLPLSADCRVKGAAVNHEALMNCCLIEEYLAGRPR